MDGLSLDAGFVVSLSAPMTMPNARARKKRSTPPPHEHHRVYVVRLVDPRGKGRECFYVGMTGLDPDVRFDNHKRGYKAAAVVKKFGVALAPEWYEDIPPMPYEEAALAEPTLADDLRDLGYVVWGPSNRKPMPRRPASKRGRSR